MTNNMAKIEFVLIKSNNSNKFLDFMILGYEYMKETASNYSVQTHEKFLNSILNKQSSNTRWLVLLKVDSISIGFIHAKIDKDERIDWGYIMEFYIHPCYRRKGFGTTLYNFIKHQFISYGIKDV